MKNYRTNYGGTPKRALAHAPSTETDKQGAALFETWVRPIVKITHGALLQRLCWAFTCYLSSDRSDI